ncbi:MAG TPA: hypothetical protein VGT44_21630, partial [Ktedonobacteraceae bacterium]|nr:hypothetical protein [Ktedonobacteraceae bacterium]
MQNRHAQGKNTEPSPWHLAIARGSLAIALAQVYAKPGSLPHLKHIAVVNRQNLVRPHYFAAIVRDRA